MNDSIGFLRKENYNLQLKKPDGSLIEIPFKSSRYNAFRLFDRCVEAFNCSPFQDLTLQVFRLGRFINVGFFNVYEQAEFWE